MEWQPIATAPKDTFIVLSDGGSLWHGFWHPAGLLDTTTGGSTCG